MPPRVWIQSSQSAKPCWVRFDSLVRDPVSPRGAPRMMVEPVVGPVGVPPPPQATSATATASNTNLRTVLTSRSSSADVNRILIRQLRTGHFLDPRPQHPAWLA